MFRCELLRAAKVRHASATATPAHAKATCTRHICTPHHGRSKGPTPCPPPLMGKLCSAVPSPRHTPATVCPPRLSRERETRPRTEPEGTYRRLGNWLQPQRRGSFPAVLRLLRREAAQETSGGGGEKPEDRLPHYVLPERLRAAVLAQETTLAALPRVLFTRHRAL